MKINPSRRLASYLSAGVCLAATEARAAIVVEFFSSPDQYPLGIYIQAGFGSVDPSGGAYTTLFFGRDSTTQAYFTHALDAAFDPDGATSDYKKGKFIVTDSGNVLGYGASGTESNYANISFTGNADVFEAVAKFELNSDGSGTLIAIATNGTSSLSIVDGAAAINAGPSAVPEPSCLLLGLLALGAAGCRRRRNAVPPRQGAL